MNSTDTQSIHRLLDQAFVGITMTPEAQDLKEEIRGNLVARVTELQATGMDATKAGAKAIAELGDVRQLVAAVSDERRPLPPHVANRVKPKPAFVLRTVVLSLVLAAGAITLALAALGAVVLLPATLLLIGLLGFALPVGLVTADALRQETSAHYRLPRGRALAYGGAALILAGGLTSATVWFTDAEQRWLLVGILLVVIAIIAFVWLGVTQTNRTKAWVLQSGEAQLEHEIGDRFSKDPAAAARFGIYTLVIWLLAIAAFVILSMTVGFAWSWLALVGGFVVFMLVLARSLFGHQETK